MRADQKHLLMKTYNKVSPERKLALYLAMALWVLLKWMI